VDYVEADIMNQLSYDVSNKKFERAGFSFLGDKNKGIKRTIEILRNSNEK